jgi:acyl dehydratase
MRDWRREAAEGRLQPGTTVRFTRTFTEEDVEIFGDLTRDFNPVHYEKRFTDKKGFSGLICHGLLVGSMICEPGGQWGWLATGMSFQFMKPVYIGDTITCEMTITEVDERRFANAEAVFTNESGETVLKSQLTGFLPSFEEGAIMSTMIAEGDPTNPQSPELADQGCE